MVRKLRASYYFIGSLLSRFGKASVGFPGGCNFGSRPIDQHIKGFETFRVLAVNQRIEFFLCGGQRIGFMCGFRNEIIPSRKNLTQGTDSGRNMFDTVNDLTFLIAENYVTVFSH